MTEATEPTIPEMLEWLILASNPTKANDPAYRQAIRAILEQHRDVEQVEVIRVVRIGESTLPPVPKENNG